MVRRLIALVGMALFVLAVPAAQADTGDIIEKQNNPPTAADGWQAATCTVDTEAEPCSAGTPGLFYKKAAGHPPFAFTQYTVKQKTVVEGGTPREVPVGPVAFIRVDLPPGLTVNPEATARCPLAQFEEPAPGDPSEGPNCPVAAKVGEERATLKVVAGPGTGTPVAPIPGVTKVPLYNLVPAEGEPALFGFKVGQPGNKHSVFLTTEVAWESDYHESFTIRPPVPTPGTLTWKSHLANFGRSGDGTYITNPTTCFSPGEFPHLYSTWLRAASVAERESGAAAAFPSGYTPFEATWVGLEECEKVPFEPSLEAAPGTNLVDSPAPATVTVKLPFDPAKEGGANLSQSHVRSAKVTLPRGMGLNPSGANGLVACTDAQFKKGQRVGENSCPAGSKVGTVEVNTPPLPDGSLVGDAYVGEQKSSDPTSGEEFRILVEAKSKRYGIVARLVGNVAADPATGQLTAIFDEQEVGPFAGTLPKGLPQVPFKSVKLRFDDGKAVLTSPPTCAKQTTTGAIEPWARPGTLASPPPIADFTLSSDPGGGSCPKTLAERPFAPSYTAKTNSKKAGAKSPFKVHIGRTDGQQELKVVDVTLPKGLTGKLAGLKYCPKSALASAAASSGLAVLGTPKCPDKSFLGTVQTSAGTGSNPLQIAGNAYLAGPYKGAPLSMAVITPAVAGPFDLGTVVVRVALNVNPRTAQINAVSDTIPDVFGGVKLDIRSIDVNVNRKKFMRNPTNCQKQATTGVLKGGGADPTDPAAFSSYAVKDPFHASKCKRLGFQPKLFTQLSGPVKRAQNPRIRAVLEARKGDANVARTALTLPHSLFLDQSHIQTVCTRVQLAAKDCPKGAVYGHATARSPLLENRLKGPVYLVSSSHQLPDLVADLRGQVNIQLHGVISSKRGGLKTVFNPVPDVPVKKFVLNMRGGDKSLLVNSTNLCKGRQTAVLNIKGQNGKQVKDNEYPLNISSCGKKK
jgi:hypothetical protein